MRIKNILTLVINHHYYRNACCRNFHIQADDLTNVFLEKNRMVIRYTKNSWKLFSDIEEDSLWVPMEFEDTIDLKFSLLSSDENFYKSIKNTNESIGVNCICNKNSDGDLKVIPCKDKNCMNWSKQEVINGKMNWKICLNLNRSTFLGSNKLFNIIFEAKEVYWKYYVFSNNNNDKVEIIDPDSEVSFLQERNEKKIDDKDVVTFISDQKLPLSECYTNTFRLVIKKGGTEKTLIKRLPVATVAGVQYKDIERKELVSLIFVNT